MACARSCASAAPPPRPSCTHVPSDVNLSWPDRRAHLCVHSRRRWPRARPRDSARRLVFRCLELQGRERPGGGLHTRRGSSRARRARAAGGSAPGRAPVRARPARGLSRAPRSLAPPRARLVSSRSRAASRTKNRITSEFPRENHREKSAVKKRGRCGTIVKKTGTKYNLIDIWKRTNHAFIIIEFCLVKIWRGSPAHECARRRAGALARCEGGWTGAHAPLARASASARARAGAEVRRPNQHTSSGASCPGQARAGTRKKKPPSAGRCGGRGGHGQRDSRRK